MWETGPGKTLLPDVVEAARKAGITSPLKPYPSLALGVYRYERGMMVVLIAHAKIERFENPETDPYDRYSPRLNKHASALVQEWCDEVLFASYKVHTKQTDEGFDKTRTRGIGTGDRILRTTERPAHMAKNRLNLPEEMPLDFRVYAEHLGQAA